MFARRLALFASLLLMLVPTTAAAAWLEARSNHFIIYSEQSQAELEAYASRLERFDQAVRIARGMKDPPLSDAGKLKVFVLRNNYLVAALSGDVENGVQGFYMPKASGPVAFVHRSRNNDRFDLQAEQVFFHEYLHHLMLQDLNLALPSWLVEGSAEFFATAELEKDGSVILGMVPEYRSHALFNYKGLSMEEMLGATLKEYTVEEWMLTYARGWLLTHYLTFNKPRYGQLNKYIAEIQRGVPAVDAAKSSFGDLKKLDAELEQYLRQKRHSGIVIPAEKIKVGPITTRQLTPGEEASMQARMRLEVGADPKFRSRPAEEMRRVATKFPGDASVQAVLAQAEFQARNSAKAIEAADRALAIDAKNRSAMITRAQAMMAIGKADKTKADWNGARTWLSKANRLDPDDAEPMMLFYRTYVLEGAAPTRNAVNGLLYAQSLVPQDRALRMMAAYQLVNDNQLAAARKMFGSIAYNPHLRKGREDYTTVMDALAAGDGNKAREMMNKIRGTEDPDGEDG